MAYRRLSGAPGMDASGASARARLRDAGDATIVGTILAVLGLTLVAAALSVVLLSNSPDDPLNARIEPDANRTHLELVHRGGEPIPIATSRLHFQLDGTETSVPLSILSDQLGNDDFWDTGETICLVGSPCPYAGHTLGYVRLVVSERVQMTYDGEVDGSAIAALSPVFDPGFSYDDQNCNDVYDGGDFSVSNQIQSGYYETDQCLVITPSEPPIKVQGAGGTVYYEGDRVFMGTSATTVGEGGRIDLVATGADETLTIGDGVRLVTNGEEGQTRLEAPGDINIGENVLIRSNGHGVEDTIVSDGDVTIEPGTVLRTNGQNGHLGITANGDITIEQVTFDAGGSSSTITLDTTEASNTIRVHEAHFNDGDDTAQADPDGVTIDGTPSFGSIE